MSNEQPVLPTSINEAATKKKEAATKKKRVKLISQGYVKPHKYKHARASETPRVC